MTPLTLALLLAGAGYEATNPGDLPTFLVGDVKHGRVPKPTGRVKIWAWRNGCWNITPPTDAVLVEWDRLLDNDRIEVVR